MAESHLGPQVSEKLRIVTTSWDDGDPRDLRVAELLRRRDLPGTFYVPLTGYRGGVTLGIAGLRSLVCEGFEIGAHGVSHTALTELSRKEIQREVNASKQYLEQSLGGAVGMFCYPRGRYNAWAQKCVRKAGYFGARTTRMLAIQPRFRRFEMPISLQAYPHGPGAYLRNIARAGSLGRLCTLLLRYRAVSGWVELGKALFDSVLRDGGIWHLYGHSWELAALDLWRGLDELLDYVSRRPGVSYLSNGNALKLCTAEARRLGPSEELCETHPRP